MNEDRILITKEELINQGFMITKKFVVIDSTLYTPEAFEYIQELITFSGSILFVSDTKKIFARGKYFGGDIFEADLLYFTSFATYSKGSDLPNNTISAKHAKSTLEIHGDNHVITSAKYIEETGRNQIHIDYDLDSAVNKESFTLDTSAEYNLEVVNGQIKMVKYIPPKIIMRPSPLPLLEYDSGDTQIVINLNYVGSLPLTKLEFTAEVETPEGTATRVDLIDLEQSDMSNVYATVPDNTDVKFIVVYSDDKRYDSSSLIQSWGYACIYGNAEESVCPTIDTFNNFNKYIISNNPSKTIIIEQNGLEYGWFACPSEFPVVFTDASTNLQGGWIKYSSFNYYGFNTEYTVYRTDHPGLGRVKWVVSKQ